MTWVAVSEESTSYEFPTDTNNLYVEFGYLENDYIRAEGTWSAVSPASTNWA